MHLSEAHVSHHTSRPLCTFIFWLIIKFFPNSTPRNSGLTGVGSGLGISCKSVKQPDGAQPWLHSLSFHMCFYTLLHMYEALNITVGQS